jgi:hypothetical protein
MTNWIAASFNRFFGESEPTRLKRVAALPELTWSELNAAEKQDFADWICLLVEQKEIADTVCRQLWNKGDEFYWRYKYMQKVLKDEIEGNA